MMYGIDRTPYRIVFDDMGDNWPQVKWQISRRYRLLADVFIVQGTAFGNTVQREVPDNPSALDEFRIIDAVFQVMGQIFDMLSVFDPRRKRFSWYRKGRGSNYIYGV